jgi:PAS domain S-box-containing protein
LSNDPLHDIPRGVDEPPEQEPTATADTGHRDGESRMLSALVEGTDAGLVVIDRDQRAIWANRNFRDRFARNLSVDGEVLGQPCHRVVCGLKEPCPECPAARPFRSGAVEHHELRVWIDDRYYYVYATGIPVRTPEGEVEQTIVMLQNVSCLQVLRRSEDAFSASEQRFRSLFEGVPAAMATVKNDGTFLQVNQVFGAMLGHTSSDLLKTSLPDMLHPDDRASFEEQFAELTAGNRPKFEGELRYRRADGATVWGHTTVVTQLDRQGAPAYTLLFIQDITRRKSSAEELEKTRRRFESLVDSFDGIVWEADAETMRFTFVSRKAEELLGFPSEQWLTQARFWRNRIHPDDLDRVTQAIERARAERQGTELTYRMIGADGRNVWLRDRVAVVAQNDGAVKLRGIMVDVSDRQGAERLLRRGEEQLAQSQRMEAIGRLASGIAHDFNTLLTTVAGYGDFLLRGLGSNHPLRREAQEIVNAAQRATELTSQLLVFARQQVLEPRVLDLDAIVAEMDLVLRRVIEEDVELITRFGSAPAKVRADAGQLQQVLLNLALNAREAMPGGGQLTIRTAAVDVDGEDRRIEPGSYVMLAVSDNGSGMTEQIRTHLFEPFFTTKERTEATGLGLSTVYGIVKQSGGQIIVDSEPRQGTEFRIYLPRVDGDEPLAHSPGEQIPEQLTGSETILLVEDSAAVRALAREILEKAGYTVIEAGGGPEAIDLCTNVDVAIDLVATDLVMPRMSGRELAARIAEILPRARVLYFSAYSDTHVLTRGLIEPGASFIQKPFVPATLLRKVREVLTD